VSAISTRTLTDIAKEHGVSTGHVSRVLHGKDDREGSYELYQALRKAGWSLTPQAIEQEAAAKVRYQRQRRKAK